MARSFRFRQTGGTGDTNNAVIEGRVALPSGFAAERYVKITVRNSVSTLYRIYTDKHGEFRFHDLSEGIYYVQAEVEGANFESAVEKVALGRGIVYELTLALAGEERSGDPRPWRKDSFRGGVAPGGARCREEGI